MLSHTIVIWVFIKIPVYGFLLRTVSPYTRLHTLDKGLSINVTPKWAILTPSPKHF